MSTTSVRGQYLDLGETTPQNNDGDLGPSQPPSLHRGLIGSSLTLLNCDEETKKSMSNAKVVFNAMHSKSGLNVRLLDPEGICVFYVNNSSFTFSRPDVTIHKGADKEGQVAGVCKWSHMWSKSVYFGVGDYNANENNVVWDEMKTVSQYPVAFRWKLETVDGPPHFFVWKRAHKEDYQDKGVNTWSRRNYKLVDEATGRMVALFGSSGIMSWRKLGTFTFTADHGERWQVMVLLTGLALVEMSRRRSRQRRWSSGGGGGP